MTRRRPGAAALAVVVVAAVLLVALWSALRAGSPTADGTADAGASGRTSSTAGPRTPGAGPSSVAPPARDTGGLPVVRLADLPREARTTLALIEAGGPFPYDRDGATFGNRERLLPRRPGGWYREYTVPTPGEDDRGARRLVTGHDGAVYWTDDHYASFHVVEEEP